MSDLFLEILNRSISAGWLVLAVLLVRVPLKKAPKWVLPLLWGIVGLRLVLPVSIESVLSLIPSAETVPQGIVMDRTPAIESGVNSINSAVNPIIAQTFTPNPAYSANPLQIWVFILSIVWILGMAAMGLYTLISYLRLRGKLRTAVLLRDNIWQSEGAGSPFVLGLFRPRIYLPFALEGEDQAHVIAHEQAHIARRDHLIKPLGFLLLTVNWFNPLLWVAYVLLCRDIELACDEKVVKKLEPAQRADYSQALLTCSVSRRRIAACPLAFGEVGVKQRVKSVLNYKKPAFWVILLAVVACIVLAVCFLTDPVSSDFDFSQDVVNWAQAMDLRAGEPVVFLLSEVERGELTARLRGLKVGKKNDDYPGFTPFYSLVVQAKNMERFVLVGFEASGKHTALQLGDEFYEITDEDFCAYLSRLCAGAGRSEADEASVEAQETIQTQIGLDGFWFDYLPDPTQRPDAQSVQLAAFPGVTFHWDGAGSISAVTDQGSQELISGMPIWNGFFWDVTGDGMPDLCATLTYGSGLIDSRVAVFDYVHGTYYELADRGNYDYVLSMAEEDGQSVLRLNKYTYPMSGDPVSTGGLGIENTGGEWQLFLAADRAHLPALSGRDRDQAVRRAILAENEGHYMGGDFACASFATLAEVVADPMADGTFQGYAVLYGIAMYQEVRFTGDWFEQTGGGFGPVVITLEQDEMGIWIATDYWTPRDGSYFADDVREKFPDWTWEAALSNDYALPLTQDCYSQIVVYGMAHTRLDVFRAIEGLIDDLEKNQEDELALRELTRLGDYTLSYVFQTFLQGGQTGERGWVLLQVMHQLVGLEEQLALEAATAQEYFDAWKTYNIQLRDQNGMEFMAEHCPMGYKLLQVMAQSKPREEAPVEEPAEAPAEEPIGET